MKKIFLDDQSLTINTYASIYNDDYHHLVNVLRAQTGESFVIGDKENKEFIGKITSIDKSKISLFIENLFIRNIKLPDISLFFSILKGDKNDYILQKCTEIGVNNFYPFLTKNTIIKSSENDSNKIKRWKKIIKEAASQSCREKIPEIYNFNTFEEIKNYGIKSTKLVCHLDDNAQRIIDAYDNTDKAIAYFIGPEGGFDINEIKMLKDLNWKTVLISPYVLRSETAAIFVASILSLYNGKKID